MAQIKISSLPAGTPKGTDITPATDVLDTSSAATGTTKKYTRSSEFNYYMTAQGYTVFTACNLATTAALTVTYANGALGVGATLTNAGAQAALALDGINTVVGDRILVKNQATAAQNGIYTVTNIGSVATNWVMTRATDYDQAAEIAINNVVLVNQGAVNAGKAYRQTNPGPFTMGTTDINFSLLSASTSGFSWVTVTGTTQTATVNTGFILSNAGASTLTLPAVAAVGDPVELQGASAAAWILTANAGQTIICGTSTTAVAGTLTANSGTDNARVVCIVANTTWKVQYTFSAGLTVA